MAEYRVLVDDCVRAMRRLPEGSVNTCVTSPPYFGLRDYGCDGQIGNEDTPDEFINQLVRVFRAVRRVLRDDGTLWVNIGDSWSNKKQLMGMPWRLAFALQTDGWYLRQDIIWNKPNAMPESVRDRCTKAHEYVFLLSKSPRYYFDHVAIKEPAIGGQSGAANSFKRKSSKRAMVIPGQTVGTHRPDRADTIPDGMRNRRDVWSVATRAFKGAHFATFPPELIEPCILAGCPEGGTVLDPFGGSGTTAGVAIKHGRNAILCELNQEYADLIPARVASIVGG